MWRANRLFSSSTHRQWLLVCSGDIWLNQLKFEPWMTLQAPPGSTSWVKNHLAQTESYQLNSDCILLDVVTLWFHMVTAFFHMQSLFDSASVFRQLLMLQLPEYSSQQWRVEILLSAVEIPLLVSFSKWRRPSNVRMSAVPLMQTLSHCWWARRRDLQD